jgi:hypothetical protein
MAQWALERFDRDSKAAVLHPTIGLVFVPMI